MWTVRPGVVRHRTWVIEPDLSNAAPFLAAALVTGGVVTVPGWPHGTTQPGDRLRHLLAEMGAACLLDARGLTVRGLGTVHGLDADLHDVGELAPVLAAVAALAETPVAPAGHRPPARPRDRPARRPRRASSCGLGGDVGETDDGLVIRPARLHGGVFHTYDDHRLATAGAVLGLVVPGVEVEDVATTAKTLPGLRRRVDGDGRR